MITINTIRVYPLGHLVIMAGYQKGLVIQFGDELTSRTWTLDERLAKELSWILKIALASHEKDWLPSNGDVTRFRLTPSSEDIGDGLTNLFVEFAYTPQSGHYNRFERKIDLAGLARLNDTLVKYFDL